MRRSIIEDTEKTTEGLADMARNLGYRSRLRGPWAAPFGQLQFPNGATASDLFEFFDDNPGAIVAVIEWVLENGRDSEGNKFEEDGEDHDFPDDPND